MKSVRFEYCTSKPVNTYEGLNENRLGIVALLSVSQGKCVTIPSCLLGERLTTVGDVHV